MSERINDCVGLQQLFQHAEYFTCDPLINQPIFIGFSLLFSEFHKLLYEYPYVMM